MIKIDTLCNHPDLSNTYIVGSMNDCIVIDPSNDARDIIKLIDGRKLLGIFLTHGHFDHFKTLEDLIKIMPTKIYLNKRTLKKLENKEASCAIYFGYNYQIDTKSLDTVIVNDGENIELGDLKIKIIYTPGHTDCGMCFLIDNNLFSGDTLFNGGFGRYDLPTASITELKNSLTKILKLNEDIIVYPGHGDETSIIGERRNDYIIRFIN